MNIAHAIYGVGLGGAQQVVASILRGRTDETFRYYVYACVDGVRRREIEQAGGVVRILPRTLPKFDPLQVWRLARTLEVPEAVIIRTPSAGLYRGQTDEDELGMGYEELDTMLMMIEAGHGDDIDSPLGARVEVMAKRNAHKLSMPPVFQVRRPDLWGALTSGSSGPSVSTTTSESQADEDKEES